MKRVLLAGTGLAVATLFSGCFGSSAEATPHQIVVTHKYEGVMTKEMARGDMAGATKETMNSEPLESKRVSPINVNYPNFYINANPKKPAKKPVDGPMISWDSYNYEE